MLPSQSSKHQKTSKIRNFNSTNSNNFTENLHNVCWGKICSLKDPDNAFFNIIKAIFNKNFPEKRLNKNMLNEIHGSMMNCASSKKLNVLLTMVSYENKTPKQKLHIAT